MKRGRTTTTPAFWPGMGGLFAAIVLILAGCADTPDEYVDDGTLKYKVGKPYQVAGVWYYPRVDYEYDEKGIASWYGVDFHGRPTANGERFDMDRVSAAHKTLPLPSIVRVTNLENNRSLVLRVNDRGPFITGRIIDLSRRAAEELGFKGKGTAMVRVQVLADESRTLAAAGHTAAMTASEKATAVPVTSVSSESLLPPVEGAAFDKSTASATSTASSYSRSAGNSAISVGSTALPEPAVPSPASRPVASSVPTAVPAQNTAPAIAFPSRDSTQQAQYRPPRIYIQAGSFLHYENATALAARLGSMGPTLVSRASVDGQTYYRVLLGPVADVATADRLLSRVASNGQRDARIIVN